MIIELLIVLVLIAIDQLSKYFTVLYLKPLNDSVQILDGVFKLTYVENTGAAFGMLKDGTLFLSVIVVIVIIMILYFKFKLPRTKHYLPLHLLSLFILAGAFGNLIDRIRLRYVIDMLHFYWFEFPVFNIADIYVTCSAILLMILLLTKYKDLDF
jgi:signal peptidase II